LKDKQDRVSEKIVLVVGKDYIIPVAFLTESQQLSRMSAPFSSLLSADPTSIGVHGSITRGVLGHISWRAAALPIEMQPPEDGWNAWNLDCGYLKGRGPVDCYAASDGWSVFAISPKPLAKHIAALLEDSFPKGLAEAPNQLSHKLSAHLFWDLIPRTAIVAYHNPTSDVCLIRDVLGFYPLYYCATKDGVALSTSLPLLKDSVGITPVNVNALSELITFGHHFGSATVWNGIDVVAPGQCVFLSRKKPPSRHWFALPEVAFDPAERERLSRRTTEQLLVEARTLVEQSLSRELTNRSFSVQGGGGVDSSVLIALTAQSHPGLSVWSINHPDLNPSESVWVEPLTSRFGAQSRFADIERENFLVNLVDVAVRSAQPLVGPNFIGGAILRQKALSLGSPDQHFINGELCDTIFGGLSSFHQLAPHRRGARLLQRLPNGMRRSLTRAVRTDRDWLSSRMIGLPESELAQAGFGSLERAELIDSVHSIGTSDSDPVQVLADRLTWLDFRRVPSALHHGFYERDEWYGGHSIFPFADKALLRFGFNLPHRFKYRAGHTKWLWRMLAADLIGREAAFRPKMGFDAPIHDWLKRAVPMLENGFVTDVFRLSRSHFASRLAASKELFWPLVNIELWGRLHCWGMDPKVLLHQLLH
jgi:asparagine synthase (glutamine-hydrolysing)